MKNGMLIGISSLITYWLVFFGIGIYLVWDSQIPQEFQGWIVYILSSMGYLILGSVLGFIVFLWSIYAFWKDPNKFSFFKKYIPIFVGLLYSLIPFNLPGPIDELVVWFLVMIMEWILVFLDSKESQTN
jgi:hypothetical protein